MPPVCDPSKNHIDVVVIAFVVIIAVRITKALVFAMWLFLFLLLRVFGFLVGPVAGIAVVVLVVLRPLSFPLPNIFPRLWLIFCWHRRHYYYYC